MNKDEQQYREAALVAREMVCQRGEDPDRLVLNPETYPQYTRGGFVVTDSLLSIPLWQLDLAAAQAAVCALKAVGYKKVE